ncbi:hypothetical protein [Photobacterium damselae]|uniref:hypothetical protein n=1 Tax=Photobacterium damselae TaxID=38293 RepID=UPI0011D0A9AA|nr:hypothetical protein [Photobacterium damselae]KAB1505049.1 hypothetical protein FD717_019095 [Photobacterium damselae subsp. damselae]
MKTFSCIILILSSGSVFANNIEKVEQGYGLGCIISTTDHQNKYCLPPGERTEYDLPARIRGVEVYVSAPPGVSVELSDYSNLSYNRLATFVGTVKASQLRQVEAKNGDILDFDRPYSMRVKKDDTPLGCILSTSTYEEYCLPPGGNSGYALPDWIKGHEVYLRADPRVEVVLSDWSALSYDRIAAFTGNLSPEKLKHVKANNGEYLDFDHPYSMKVRLRK